MKVIGINKTQMVRDMLVTHPKLKAKEIAEAVDCDVTIVYEQRRKALKGKQMTAKKLGRPAKKLGRPAKKKLGRPSNEQVVSEGIADASTVLTGLAEMYGLLITIYGGTVTIIKSDVSYECTPADVPALLGTIAFLSSYEKE
jgi:hypothetical protein